MKRRLAILTALLSVLGAASARADSAPPLSPAVEGHLLGQVGAPVPASPRFRSGFVIEAQHGYELQVLTSGTAVVLDVYRKERRPRTRLDSYYVARGVSAPQRMQATFGSFGKVSMRFRPAHGATGRSHLICHRGTRLRQRRGLFVGQLEFKGEAGYVSVATHRAKGSVTTPAGRCPISPKARKRLREEFLSFFEPLAAVYAIARDGVDSTGFLTLKQKRTEYLAFREETRGRLAIVRYASVQSSRPFHPNEAASAANVQPPAPFHGSGRYRAAADGSTSWGGNLTVNFPGAPRFPLTGPTFDAFLEAPF